MAAKNATKATKTSKKPVKRASKRPPIASGVEAVELIATALAGHDAAIQQLAEVAVNLHANLRAIRDLVEALADAPHVARAPRVAAARARLRRVKLDD